MRNRPFWVTLLGVAAILAVVATIAHKPKPKPFTPRAGYQLGQNVEPNHEAVLFVGDSMTAGTGSDKSIGGFAQQVAQRRGWILNLDAQGNTGFINDGHNNDPTNEAYPARLAKDRQRYLADVIVVTGGTNDLGFPDSQIQSATSSYLRQIRADYPRAKLVIVAPIVLSPSMPAPAYVLRNTERDLAPQLAATFVDPIAEQWISGNPNRANYVGGQHPNPAGHKLIADRIVAHLDAANIH